VNQSCALERMVLTFTSQVALRNSPQLFIHKGNKDLQGFLVPGSPLAEERADRLGERLGHTHTVSSAPIVRP
jgi:hypothetical protein